MARTLASLLAAGMRSRTLGVGIYRITPEIAECLLAFHGENRPRRDKKSQRFARLILEGKYFIHGQGITFDRNGRGLDGQHRLKGISLSGRAVDMVVVYGVDPDAWVALDSPTRRSLTDVVERQHWLQKVGQATVRAMVKGLYQDDEHRDPAMVELLEKAETYRVGLMFIAGLLPKNPIKSSAIAHRPALKGALVRAFYNLDNDAERELLDEFCQSIRQGEIVGIPTPCKAVGLQLLLDFGADQHHHHGGQNENDQLYRTTERAWRIFKNEISGCSPWTSSEVFSLPGEELQAVVA